MSMTLENIEKCKQIVGSCSGVCDIHQYKDFLNSLATEAEFKKFVEQTDVGYLLNERLVSLFKDYETMIRSLKDLVNDTKVFLDNEVNIAKQ